MWGWVVAGDPVWGGGEAFYSGGFWILGLGEVPRAIVAPHYDGCLGVLQS